MNSPSLNDFVTFTELNPKCEKISQPINDQCSSPYRDQSIDLHFKSIDWFLYNGKHWSLMD